MKRKYAIMGLVLALSIMATPIANAALLSVTKVKGKYSVWSVGTMGLPVVDNDNVYFQYRILDNNGVPLPGDPGNPEKNTVYLTGFVDNSVEGKLELVFEIKYLNGIIDEIKKAIDPGCKIDITKTVVKFWLGEEYVTATGPAWRRRPKSY